MDLFDNRAIALDHLRLPFRGKRGAGTRRECCVKASVIARVHKVWTRVAAENWRIIHVRLVLRALLSWVTENLAIRMGLI